MRRCDNCHHEWEGSVIDCPACDSENTYPIPELIDYQTSGTIMKFLNRDIGMLSPKQLRDKLRNRNRR